MTEASADRENHGWLALLGLEEDPFAAERGPEYFFAEPAFVQRLDLLTHLLQFSDSLLVVLGEPGAGKSSLLRELRARAGDNWRLSVQRGDEVHSLDSVLRRLAGDLGLEDPPAGGEALPERVMGRCADLREATQLPVLIIDDAQQVPPSLLRGLAGLAGNPGATVRRLRILLFGTSELEGLLAQAGLAPGLAPFVQTLSVPRFNETQAAAYLMYRLTVAGYAGESPFSSTEVRAIAKASDGLPGAINQLARDTLHAHAGQAGLDLGKGGRRRRWPLPLLAGLLLVAGGWWWLADREQPPEPQRLAERPLSLPTPPATGRIEPREPVPVPDPEPARLPLPDIPLGEEPAGDEVAREDTAEPIVPAEPVPDPEPVAPETPSAPAPEPASAPEPEPVPEPAPEPEPEPEAAQPPPPAPAEPEPEPEPAAAPEPATVAAPVGQGQDWIRAQAPGHHTLQLLVSSSEDAVRAFIAQHGLQGELVWYPRRQQGQDRYVLLYGSYPSSAAARAAIAGLPARVQRDQPWPRSFASVQAELPTP